MHGFRVSLVLLIVLVAFQDGPAHAEIDEKFLLFGDEALLAGTATLKVIVDDQVKGRCFLNAEAVKNTVELSLRKHGFRIKENTDANAFFEVQVFGYADENISGNKIGCIVYI
jgi:hypothetical protein